ncbi:hypothetical protein A0H76_2843 [Hepatospora eriocheir]|uniref:Uncharacterized protein n=1 Tax=Hepatospora eriocheir TaxID=1081669 RepID=A0A1X0Q5G3_9MICR|nr:hypothetical protein A0H76_2843 [Hepatospora eriocheir]
MIVQINKSLFRYKQEYHLDKQPVRKIWVFELTDCLFSPAKISLHIVSNNTAKIPQPIIIIRICVL